MRITRDQLIDKVVKDTEYYKRDVRAVFNSFERVIVDLFAEVTEEDSIEVNIMEGVKIGCKVVPERNRVNPKDQTPIIVGPTVKPMVRYSDTFRKKIQDNFDNNAESESD